MKTASKRAIQKTAEATGDLIGNEIEDKITCFKGMLFQKFFEGVTFNTSRRKTQC